MIGPSGEPKSTKSPRGTAPSAAFTFEPMDDIRLVESIFVYDTPLNRLLRVRVMHIIRNHVCWMSDDLSASDTSSQGISRIPSSHLKKTGALLGLPEKRSR